MYHPISEYALIGNRHTCALVARDGSIDWCCFPHLDSPSVFAAILDHRRGGHWCISPAGETQATRRYVGYSAVLETEFRGAGGRLLLTDFLPIRQGRGEEDSYSAHAIVRCLRCLEGEVEVEVEWMPRPDYARADVEVALAEGGAVARTGTETLWLAGFPASVPVSIEGAAARATVPLRAGQRFALACNWGESDPRYAAERAEEYLGDTLAWWEAWAEDSSVEPGADRWTELIMRSGMVLKLLTQERTGAIAAAPTTSLPEEVGGIRNWDYRYCWVRDASMIAQAFVTLGRRKDGIAFLNFLEQAARQHHDPSRIQVVYGLQGETRLTEYNLGHLDGYRDSRPVRIGNAAAFQRQVDVYGELLEAAWDLLEIGAPLSPQQWAWLRGIADYVCDAWRLRDRGIWEVRGPERHFTYSKVMCWVALDRALRIGAALRWQGDTSHWERERATIHRMVLENSFDEEQNSFVQCFESTNLDASNLLIPIVGFLPPTDPRVQGTIDATLQGLTENGLVYRYHAEETPDGVGGSEGAFGICTFWLCTALALSGRIQEAREIFEGMLARTNDLGLYAEEIDPRSGEFLGNFPQAFTHVGLINAAHHLGRALDPLAPPGLADAPASAAPGAGAAEGEMG